MDLSARESEFVHEAVRQFMWMNESPLGRGVQPSVEKNVRGVVLTFDLLKSQVVIDFESVSDIMDFSLVVKREVPSLHMDLALPIVAAAFPEVLGGELGIGFSTSVQMTEGLRKMDALLRRIVPAIAGDQEFIEGIKVKGIGGFDPLTWAT